MNCQEFLDQLQQYLDGDAALADDDHEAHLRNCSICAARFTAARRLIDGLRYLAPPVPPLYLAGTIVAKAKRNIRRRRLVRYSAYAGSLAAAALVLAAIRLFWMLPDQPVKPGSKPTKQEIAIVSPVTPKENAPIAPLRDTVAEAGHAVASLTSRTADQAVDQTLLLLPIVTGPSLTSLELPSADAAASIEPLLIAGNGVSAGLEPVASSARRAVDLFFRDLPATNDNGRNGL